MKRRSRAVARGAVVAVTLIVLIAATFARTRSHSDVLSNKAVTPEALRSLIAAAHFTEPGPITALHTRDGVPRATATFAPLTVPVGDSATMAAGVIVAKINTDRAYEPGLVPGDNYMWIDGQGPKDQPWRAVMISADGNTRRLLGSVKYTPDAGHAGPDSPATHAQRYCDGRQGCFVKRVVGGLAGGKPIVVGLSSWMRCNAGCCDSEF